ncbi:hypothetical protein D3C85_1007490 [compost metagenome]
MLTASTKSFQFVVDKARRLPMLLLMDTWSAACCWFSATTICSMVRLDWASRCSNHVKGRASAGPWPWRRLASSATNEPSIGGFDRAMLAMTRMRPVGSSSADLRMASAHVSASPRFMFA